MMGQFIKVEEHSSKGSSDAVVETLDTVYIFEFKLSENGTVAQAVQQIETKNYAMRYQMSGKKIVKIGVQFDNNIRTLGDWEIIGL
jgi:ribosomal protein L9